ncbi:MAG: tetratricopeptide repeat protein [Paludibacteraceae bacterium]
MIIIKNIFAFILLFLPVVVLAQNESNDILAGNRLYKKEKFTEAEIAYRKAIVKNNQSFEANYNLGNALYKQGKYDEALKQYQAALPFIKTSKKQTAADLHNLGNTLLSQQKIQESIKAYESALKMNPSDNDTRYNLAYANALLKKQQQDKGNNKDNKDKKNNKDQQNKEQQNDNKDQQDKKDKQPQPEPQQPQMSKENAQQILDALEQDERATKENVDKAKARVIKRAEKDW